MKGGVIKTGTQSKNKKIKKWIKIAVFLMFYDFIAIYFSYFFGLWIRFDFSFQGIPKDYLYAFVRFTPIYAAITIVFFWFMKLYRSIWSFVGVNELIRYTIASTIASICHCIFITVFFERMPFSYYIVGAVIQLILVVGIRVSYRLYLTIERNRTKSGLKPNIKRVMIIGGGSAGREIIRELLSTESLKAFPCCIIDDNRNKWNRFIDGVPVVGEGNRFLTM